MFGEILIPGKNIFNVSEGFIFIFTTKGQNEKKKMVHQFKFIPYLLHAFLLPSPG